MRNHDEPRLFRTPPHVLVIRVWLEPDHEAPLRVRLLGVPDAARNEVPLAVVTNPEDAVAFVGEWLRLVARSAAEGDGGLAAT